MMGINNNDNNHFHITALILNGVLDSKFHRKNHSHIQTSNLLFQFIGEYLLLIISITIIYWFRIQNAIRKNILIHICIYIRLVSLNVNAQFTMELVRALHTNSSIKQNVTVCLFGWSLSIWVEKGSYNNNNNMKNVKKKKKKETQIRIESESEKKRHESIRKTQRDAQKFRQLWMRKASINECIGVARFVTSNRDMNNEGNNCRLRK